MEFPLIFNIICNYTYVVITVSHALASYVCSYIYIANNYNVAN